MVKCHCSTGWRQLLHPLLLYKYKPLNPNTMNSLTKLILKISKKSPNLAKELEIANKAYLSKLPGKLIKRHLTIDIMRQHKKLSNGKLFIVFVYTVSGSKYLLKRYEEITGDNYVTTEDGKPLFFSTNYLIPSITNLYIHKNRIKTRIEGE